MSLSAKQLEHLMSANAAACNAALDALKMVEWIEMMAVDTCPWCEKTKAQGHAHSCARQRAIKMLEARLGEEMSDWPGG